MINKNVRDAYQNRTKGDYDAFVIFTEPEVLEMLFEMKEFIAILKKHI